MVNKFFSVKCNAWVWIIFLSFGYASSSFSKESDEKIIFAYHQSQGNVLHAGPVRTTFVFCFKKDILKSEELMSVVFTTKKKYESSRVETDGVKSDGWVVQRFSVMNDFFENGRNVSLYFKDTRYKNRDYSKHVIDVKNLLNMPNISKYKILELPKPTDCSEGKQFEKEFIQKINYGVM